MEATQQSLIKPDTIKIGIIGKQRSGKDTLAELIEAKTGYWIEYLAFSDAIKRIVRDYMPDIYGQGKPREAYQKIGQLFREFDKDVWVKNALQDMEVEKEFYNRKHFIFTDVRQPNEAKVLKEDGFVLVKIEADTEARIERAKKNKDNFSPEHLEHETEKAVDECEYDYLINNSGTLEDLEEAVEDLLLQMTVGGNEDIE